jgi:hypothetical protein
MRRREPPEIKETFLTWKSAWLIAGELAGDCRAKA